MIDAIEGSPPEQADRLQEILEADTNTDEEVLEALSIIEEAGSIDDARERALELAAQARAEIDRLDFDEETSESLREFTRFVVDRDV